MIFDTHAHYDDEAFDPDREELLASLAGGGIGAVVNIGSSLASTQTTLDLAEQYSWIYGAAGVHPSECAQLDEEGMKWLEQVCSHPKIVAVGEIGLDYYWEEPEHELQKKWFCRQLDLARRTGLPVVIHSRDAAQDTLEIMKSEKAGQIGGVVHCYSYSREMAREYLNMGFFIGIGGVLTFKNARKLKETAEYVPMESIVLETDCPYLAPVPNRGKRNSSLNLPYVAAKIAEIKQVDVDTVVSVTEENAGRLFGI